MSLLGGLTARYLVNRDVRSIEHKSAQQCPTCKASHVLLSIQLHLGVLWGTPYVKFNKASSELFCQACHNKESSSLAAKPEVFFFFLITLKACSLMSKCHQRLSSGLVDCCPLTCSHLVFLLQPLLFSSKSSLQVA